MRGTQKREECQSCTIPSSYCESDQVWKLNGQGFNLEKEPHFLTLKVSGFGILWINHNDVFPGESFFIYAFIHFYFYSLKYLLSIYFLLNIVLELRVMERYVMWSLEDFTGQLKRKNT